jgi:hypothetical protein
MKSGAIRFTHKFGGAVLVGFLAACNGQIDSHDGETNTTPQPDPDPQPFDVASLSAEHTLVYLTKLSAPLVGRVLTEEERTRIATDGGLAIEPILEDWGNEPGLVKAARALMEEKLAVSGGSGEIDYALPGNLVEHIVKNDIAWREVLTSETCFDATDAPIACDTGAPFTAGVLTTRGFLKSRAGHFNLGRAGGLMRAFACQVYPQEETLQPKVELTHLKSMFAITDLNQVTEEAEGVAVNLGCACNDCHGQFAAHTQLFVKFTRDGVYTPEATGEQDPMGELGNGLNGTLTSHFETPDVASSEKSQIFGKDVNNLAEAAQVVADHPIFLQCAAQNIIEYTLRVEIAGALGKSVSADVLADIAKDAGNSATFADLVRATFTDPDIVLTVLDGLIGSEEGANP